MHASRLQHISTALNAFQLNAIKIAVDIRKKSMEIKHLQLKSIISVPTTPKIVFCADVGTIISQPGEEWIERQKPIELQFRHAAVADVWKG